MLTKTLLFIVILAACSPLLNWLWLIDATTLRELTTSILVALILQPVIMQQFR